MKKSLKLIVTALLLSIICFLPIKTRAAAVPEVSSNCYIEQPYSDTYLKSIKSKFHIRTTCKNVDDHVDGMECQVFDSNNKLIERAYTSAKDHDGEWECHWIALKKVKVNKVYKYRVRGYIQKYDNNTKKWVKTYGKWSVIKKDLFLKCSYKLKTVKIKNKKTLQVKIKIPKVKGVKRYRLWINDKKYKTLKGGKSVTLQINAKNLKKVGITSYKMSYIEIKPDLKGKNAFFHMTYQLVIDQKGKASWYFSTL